MVSALGGDDGDRTYPAAAANLRSDPSAPSELHGEVSWVAQPTQLTRRMRWLPGYWHPAADSQSAAGP